MRDPLNILVAGVGGQGNIVCGRILAEAAILDGLRPVVGDTFGASRRGGSVTTHVRIGSKDWGPLIPAHDTDILLGLETMETYRAAARLASEKTTVVVPDIAVPTQEINEGRHKYSSFDVYVRHLSLLCRHESALVYPVQTGEALQELQSSRALNVYMVGVMSGIVQEPFQVDSLRTAVARVVGGQVNIDAFEMGLRDAKRITPVGPFTI